MLLGKRPRRAPIMKRTASLKEIVFDVGGGDGDREEQKVSPNNNPVLDGLDERILAMVSPRNNRRHSGEFFDTSSQFLRTCSLSLCQRRLVPGRDIYMYKGDSGFCSPECRQQQMNLDDGKEKCAMGFAVSSVSATINGGAESVAAV